MTLGTSRPTDQDAGGIPQPSLGSSRSDDPRNSRETRNEIKSHNADAGGIPQPSLGTSQSDDPRSMDNAQTEHYQSSHTSIPTRLWALYLCFSKTTIVSMDVVPGNMSNAWAVMT